MPPKGKPRPDCAHYRLRFTATMLLAAGVIFCAVKSTAPPAPESAAPASSPLTQAPSSAPSAENPATILIDPGHGGADPGTGAHGQSEKTWTLTVGLDLAKELRARGWSVEMTRSDDATLHVIDRAALSNQRPRLAFVSLHFNAGGAEATGVETYYSWPRQPETMARLNALHETPDGQSVLDDRSRLLASHLLTALCAATGAKNREVRNNPAYTVTSRTLCPSALVELGFLTNPAECRLIQTDAYREKLVRGLADGLESWLHESRSPGYGIHFEPLPATPLPIATSLTTENP